MAQKTPRQIRDELKAGYVREIADHEESEATADAEEAAVVYLSGITVGMVRPRVTLQYPHAADDRKAKLGAAAELALNDPSTMAYLKISKDRKVTSERLKYVLDTFFPVADEAARQRRDGLQHPGLKQERESNIAENERSEAKSQLDAEVNQYRIKKGVLAWADRQTDSYTDDELGAWYEIMTTDVNYWNDRKRYFAEYVDAWEEQFGLST